MPSPSDLAERFAEYLRQTELGSGTRLSYTSQVRLFGQWLVQNPQYADALTDTRVRDAALAAYWGHLTATRRPATLKVARFALIKMFGWLELPVCISAPASPGGPSAQVTYEYGEGTWIEFRYGSPFKAKALCVDGKVRTTDYLSTGRGFGLYTAAMSVIVDHRRYKIAGWLVTETCAGSIVDAPKDPLVVKFEAAEHGVNAQVIGFGLYRTPEH